VRWEEEAEEGGTWGRVAEFLIGTSGISHDTSGVGLVQQRHRNDLIVDKAAGKKRGDARRRVKFCGEHQI
jgi:hypothetical protein